MATTRRARPDSHISRRARSGNPRSRPALKVISSGLWQASAPGETLSSEPRPGPLPPDPTQDPPLGKGS
jgi:hypothetical protein